MKSSGVELAPRVPAAKPFFYGYWADTNVGVNTNTLLSITTVPLQQKGMILSGGGCKVPIPGIYQIGAMSRSDITGSGATYSEFLIVVNGSAIAYSIAPNGSTTSQTLPYAYHQLWVPQALKAGDVVTVMGYGYPVACTFFGAASWPGDGLRVMYDSPLSDVA